VIQPPFIVFHSTTCVGLFTAAGIVAAALEAGECSILLTTYDQLRLNRDLLLPVRWGVAVLDEGHKIRNPDAEVSCPSVHCIALLVELSVWLCLLDMCGS
jgi:hypothetical protein